MEELISTRKFFDSVVNSEYTHRRVTFAGSASELDKYDSDFLFSSKNDVLEVMVFKKTIKTILQEVHPILEKYISGGQVIPDEESLIKLYYMTAGMLIVSHEHHTIINIHEEIVFKILNCELPVYTDLLLDTNRFIYKELYFIQSLLNSNNNKLNKSSSIWHLFKKLFIFTHDNNTPNIDSAFFFNTALKAAELHSSNYYAWNFIVFVANVLKLESKCRIYGEYVEQIQKFCYSHQTDNSAWSCLTESISLNSNALKLATFEYNRYSKKPLPTDNAQKLLLLFPGVNQHLMALSKWIWENKIHNDAPFHAFQRLCLFALKVWQEKDLVLQLFEQVKIHTSLFEELKLKREGLTVEVTNGYFKTNADLSSDLELYQMIENYYNWKRLLDLFERFVKIDNRPFDN